jgi:hypothetical protein
MKERKGMGGCGKDGQVCCVYVCVCVCEGESEIERERERERDGKMKRVKTG